MDQSDQKQHDARFERRFFWGMSMMMAGAFALAVNALVVLMAGVDVLRFNPLLIMWPAFFISVPGALVVLFAFWADLAWNPRERRRRQG